MTPHRFDHTILNFAEKQLQTYRIENVFDDSSLKAYQELLKFYYPDMIVKPPATKQVIPGNSSQACRFCLRKSPEVTFRKEAHLLPQLMGDRNLLHDVECDDCNKRFGRFENSFANFLGIYRTLDKMHGREAFLYLKVRTKEYGWNMKKTRIALISRDRMARL